MSWSVEVACVKCKKRLHMGLYGSPFYFGFSSRMRQDEGDLLRLRKWMTEHADCAFQGQLRILRTDSDYTPALPEHPDGIYHFTDDDPDADEH